MEMTQIHWDQFQSLLAELRQQDGAAWKEIKAEVHSQYLEIPFWILLYDDFDLAESNRCFWDCAARHSAHLAPFRLMVSYSVIVDERIGIVETLIAADEDIGRNTMNEVAMAAIEWKKLSSHSIFSARDSRRD